MSILSGPGTDARPDPTTLPTQRELAKLPAWTRVAFAARCARRVLGLVPERRPTQAIELAERAAALGRLTPRDLRAAQRRASDTAGEVLDHYGYRDGAAHFATYSAERAVRAAVLQCRAAPGRRASSTPVLEAMEYALRAVDEYFVGEALWRDLLCCQACAAQDVDDDTASQWREETRSRVHERGDQACAILLREIRRDYESLLRAAGSWDNHSVVTRRFFGPLWSEEPPLL